MNPLRGPLPPIPLEYAKPEGRWPPLLEWKTLGLIVCYVALMHAATLGRAKTRQTAFAACLWNRWRRRRRPARDAQRITLRPPALRQSVR